MGLLALAALTAQQRTKELGVRKVLGARVPGLVLLLCGEYGWLEGLGNVLAWPGAYWVANRWLQGFAYRIELGADLFATTALVTLIVALMTVGGHALRAALANPVEALRYE
ncbi:MAG: FtsX-like permease family protein, partial [Candidatus Latescibacterota bacterium]|jgi:putative ABC transport system permease protein